MVIPACTVARIRTNALIDIKVLAFNCSAHIQRYHQTQLILAVELAVVVEKRDFRQQRGARRNDRAIGCHRRAANQRHGARPFYRGKVLRLEEDERRVLLKKLTHFGFAVLFAPLADRLHRHIFFFTSPRSISTLPMLR